MSTSAVSSSSLSQQLQAYFQTRKTDVQQLGQALSSGNLSSAQTAYNAISTLGQSGPFSDGHAFISQTREQDFEAVGSALQSGDLAGAQQAFAQLQSTFQNGGANSASTAAVSSAATGASASATGPEIILNLSGAGSGTNPEQITINIGPGNSGGGDQVSLTVGQGSNAQQVNFNLNPNSNEQVVLNLAEAANGTTTITSSIAGGPSSGGSVNFTA
jgi:hypothetical protein